MAETLTLARPYAKAVFEIAREHAALEVWGRALEVLAALVRDASVARLLGDPLVPPAERAAILLELAQKSGLKPDAQLDNFVRLLAQNRRLPVLPDIAADFAVLRAEAEGSVTVEVRAAGKLDTDEQARIAAALQKKLGRKVEIHSVTDASLIGGAVITAGDLVIDGSVRDKLGRLAAALIQ